MLSQLALPSVLMGDGIQYEPMSNEDHLDLVNALCIRFLSEVPRYSRWTYRLFYDKEVPVSRLVWDTSPSEELKNQYEDLLDRNGRLLIACCLCSANGVSENRDYAEVRKGYIGAICVLEPYRCRGIGTKLLKMSLDVFRALKKQMVYLDTEAHNTTAINFYEGEGFVRYRLLTNWYSGVDAYRLMLPLE